MTPSQEAEVKLMSLNISAVLTPEQIAALCSQLLEVDLSTLRAWLARQKERD